jgi:hypothetical protein
LHPAGQDVPAVLGDVTPRVAPYPIPLRAGVWEWAGYIQWRRELRNDTVSFAQTLAESAFADFFGIPPNRVHYAARDNGFDFVLPGNVRIEVHGLFWMPNPEVVTIRGKTLRADAHVVINCADRYHVYALGWWTFRDLQAVEPRRYTTLRAWGRDMRPAETPLRPFEGFIARVDHARRTHAG